MKNLKYILSALFTILMWGISLPVTTILLGNGFSPNLITFFRFSIAALTMLIIFRNKLKKKIDPQDKKYFYCMGLGGTTLFFFFENTALKYTTVSNTALITATIPLFTLLTAAVLFKKKILWQNIIGIPLGLTGTAFLFLEDLKGSGVHLKGDLLAAGSVILWILYSFSYRKVMNKYPPLIIVFYTFLYGCFFSLPLLMFDIGSLAMIRLNLSSISAVLYLAVLCSFLSYYLWSLALKNIGVKATSNFILFMPVVSVGVGIIFLLEPLTWKILLAGTAIIASSWLTSISHEESYF